MNDFSIDLETLGTSYDSAILSIGCVQFDRATGDIGDKFYQEVDFHSAIANGRISADTLLWWMDQGESAKRVFNIKDKENLPKALYLFYKFIRDRYTDGKHRVWGNGATFDITILEHAVSKIEHGLSLPWHFKGIRDMRTLVEAAEAIDGNVRRKVPRVGTHHRADDDAEHQAKVIANCWQTVVGLPVTRFWS